MSRNSWHSDNRWLNHYIRMSAENISWQQATLLTENIRGQQATSSAEDASRRRHHQKTPADDTAGRRHQWTAGDAAGRRHQWTADDTAGRRHQWTEGNTAGRRCQQLADIASSELLTLSFLSLLFQHTDKSSAHLYDTVITLRLLETVILLKCLLTRREHAFINLNILLHELLSLHQLGATLQQSDD